MVRQGLGGHTPRGVFGFLWGRLRGGLLRLCREARLIYQDLPRFWFSDVNIMTERFTINSVGYISGDRTLLGRCCVIFFIWDGLFFLMLRSGSKVRGDTFLTAIFIVWGFGNRRKWIEFLQLGGRGSCSYRLDCHQIKVVGWNAHCFISTTSCICITAMIQP